MNSYNGMPIDKGDMIFHAFFESVFVLIVMVVFIGIAADLKKRYRNYKAACNKTPNIAEDSEKYEKKLRKFNRKKQESKKKAGIKLLGDIVSVVLVGFCLAIVMSMQIGTLVDCIYNDYTEAVSEYEIVVRRTTGGHRRKYVVLEDGTTLEYDAMVGKENGETGKARFIYGKRSEIIVGFEEIE